MADAPAAASNGGPPDADGMDIETEATATKQIQPIDAALKTAVKLIEKSVKLKDTRLLSGRLMRQTAAIRKQLSADTLRSFISKLPATPSSAYLLSQVQVMAQLGVDWRLNRD
jgi:hypothetical protein